ncbi:hypothetical protein EV363DRAFT_1178499 [Boletus edulis]|nr:hypothetical protein EV363DRAFT_1178499 [Boletus edulis]
MACPPEQFLFVHLHAKPRKFYCIDSILLSPLQPIFQEPDLQIDDAALALWKQTQLTNTEALLTVAITTSQNIAHHVLASWALVRARLREWDTALVDAKKPSVIGYIAKTIALVGKDERHKRYCTCDIAFARFHAFHVTSLLLIKTIIVFIGGDHLDAISRVDALIATVTSNTICYVAYMYLLLGNSCIECSDYEGAIESFEHTRAHMQPYGSQQLLMISLIIGWQFADVDMTIKQRLCDALYAAGRTKDAVESFSQMTSELGGETNLRSDHLE